MKSSSMRLVLAVSGVHCVLSSVLAVGAVPVVGQVRSIQPAPEVASIAVERSTGSIAVGDGTSVTVLKGPGDATGRRFPVPGRHADVVAFARDRLLLAVDRDDELPGSFVVLDTAGHELRRWGPGDQVFPSLTTRLSVDGSAIADMIEVNQESRSQLPLPGDYADGTFVLVSERLADRVRRVVQLRLWVDSKGKRSTTTPQDMIGLGPGDFLVTVGNGSLLRVQSGAEGWSVQGQASGRCIIADVDPGSDQVLVVDGAGAVSSVALGTGERRWRWSGVDNVAEVERFLGQTGQKGGTKKVVGEALDRMSRTGHHQAGTTDEAAALRVAYGVETARALPNGKVLLASSLGVPYGGKAWLAVLDPQSGRLQGTEVFDTLAARTAPGAVVRPTSGGSSWEEGLHVLPSGEVVLRASPTWIAVKLQ